MLLKWADTAIERSTNNPSLPHAIIVLNKTETAIPDEDWDQLKTTNFLFESMDRSLHTLDKFKPYLQKWERPGRTLNTKGLLQCYYTTVQAIRIPNQAAGIGRPNKVDAQVSALYRQIGLNGAQAQRKKLRSRMLLNADQFDPYLQFAFKHFSSPAGLEKPFDFVQASFLNSPISNTFGDQIVKVGRHLKTFHPTMEFGEILNTLSPFIASCIMLDATRNGRVGNANVILPQYAEHCRNAIEGVNLDWPCSFPGCVNRRSGHSLGHQNSNGQLIGISASTDGDTGLGNFQEGSTSYQNPTNERSFLMKLEQDLANLLNRRSDSGIFLAPEVCDLHKSEVRLFYEQHGGNRGALAFQDNVCCVLCLTGAAVHPLACGHVICEGCLTNYGTQVEGDGNYITRIDECPMHSHLPWQAPLIIRAIPKEAGVRLLALDGYVCSEFILSLISSNSLQRGCSRDFTTRGSKASRETSWRENSNSVIL
jgi:hypothetical protein